MQSIDMPQQLTLTLNDVIQQVKTRLLIPNLVENVVQQRVILQAAAEEGITISTEELQKAADAMRTANNLLSAQSTLTWLERHHLSIEDFEDIAYYTLVQQKLAQKVCASQVEAYFAAHQLDYAIAVIYEVKIEDHDLAMELFYALTEGDIDFLSIVHQYLEPANRLRGQYRRIVRRRDLKPNFSAVIFAAQPPTVLKPIRVDRQSHLIYVTELIEPELTAEVRQQIMEQLFQEWLRQKSKQVVVQMNFASTGP
jgi:hypothetical protein